MTTGERAAVQSVDRALRVLEILARDGRAGVTEIAAELGVHKSTASRLIAVLVARGYVAQTGERGPYRLGFAITRLAGDVGGRPDLGPVGQDVCDDLASRVAETVNLAILDGDQIVNVVEAIGPGEITLRTWVGQRCPAHATSSGKTLLADVTDLPRRLGDPLAAFTNQTVTSVAALSDELDEVRRAGWASVAEELEIGLNAVAAPVLGADGRVLAALSVSGPSYRLSSARFAETATITVAAAGVISARLGWAGGGARPPRRTGSK